MLTVFHAPQSRSSRMLWILEELGADYQIHYCDIARRDGSGAADPANPHPDGKVPALSHDDVVVTESIAITQYLTDLYPDAEISRPIGHVEHGAHLSWLAWYAGVFEPVMTFVFTGLGDNPALHRTFRGRDEAFARIIGALERGPYLLGDRVSAVDVLMADAGRAFRTLMPEGDLVDAYLARMCDRPAFAIAQTKEFPPS